MLRQLLSFFRTDDNLGEMGRDFARMLELARDVTEKASEMFLAQAANPEERAAIYARDIEINKLERKIRKQVIAHLSIPGNSASAPYCLLLMSLVKDVERIGDYAKNLAEVLDVHGTKMPEDALLEELRAIGHAIKSTFAASAEVFESSDHERAVALIRGGRDIAHRCDTLVSRIALSQHDAGTATALVLGARFYKRIGGHVLNVLSSVVMPLHKLDYYDEDALPSGVVVDDD